MLFRSLVPRNMVFFFSKILVIHISNLCFDLHQLMPCEPRSYAVIIAFRHCLICHLMLPFLFAFACQRSQERSSTVLSVWLLRTAGVVFCCWEQACERLNPFYTQWVICVIIAVTLMKQISWFLHSRMFPDSDLEPFLSFPLLCSDRKSVV